MNPDQNSSSQEIPPLFQFNPASPGLDRVRSFGIMQPPLLQPPSFMDQNLFSGQVQGGAGMGFQSPFDCPPGLVSKQLSEMLPSEQFVPEHEFPSPGSNQTSQPFLVQQIQVQTMSKKRLGFSFSEKPQAAPVHQISAEAVAASPAVKSKLTGSAGELTGSHPQLQQLQSSSSNYLPLFQQYIQPACPLNAQQLLSLNQNLVSQGCSSKSRAVQQQIEELHQAGYAQHIDAAIAYNLHSMRQLTEDKYGNYLMQLLVRYCSQPVLEQLLELFRDQIEQYSFNQFSCRVIQLAVERCGQLQLPQFVQLVYVALTKTHSLALRSSNSQFASHILLVCLQQMSVQSYQGYVMQVSNQYLNIACDQYGCRILEYMYKKVETYKEHEVCANLMNCLEQHVKVLSAHKFGNYLVQAALRNKFYQSSQLTLKFQTQLIQIFAELAKSKYGSNTCECLIQVSDYQFIVRLSVFLTKNRLVRELVEDQFGNFIVQMLIQKFNETYKECECPKCYGAIQTFGDQQELSEELVQNENGEIQPLERDCRATVFKLFGGVVKLILEDVQNLHVQRCLAKHLEFAELQEIEEAEFARRVEK